MKKEDLFKYMSELDDNLIAEAGEEGVEVNPIHIAERKKRFNIKPVAVTAACCVLLAGVVAAVGINYFRGGLDVLQPQNTDISVAIYPENAKYQYKGDYSEFKDFDVMTIIDYAETYNSYRDLLNACDLAVVGEFIDDPWQDIDPNDSPKVYHLDNYSNYHIEVYPLDYNSYNCFKIDKILGGSGYGTVLEGSNIIIGQSYAIKGESFLSHSKLTPMLKGDRWVYFLTYDESNGTYYPLNDYMGRYPVPDESAEGNRQLPAMTNKYGLTEARDFNKNIYNTLKEILNSKNMSVVECLYDAENLETYNVTSFEIAEFEGLEFALKEDGVLYYKELYVSGDGMVLAGLDEVINKIYLADLNDDGKREICIHSCSNAEVLDGYILIWDYANQKVYGVVGETGKTEYYLEESDGELIAINTKCTSDGSRGEVVSYEKLSLDMNDCFLHLDMSGHYERCQYDSDYCARQDGDCPYRQGEHHDETDSTEHHGHSEYCLQDADYCAQQDGECSYRHGEHHDETNSTEHHGHSEYCLQDADYCAQQDGDCPYRHGEHNDEENSSEHHGHSEYCLQDAAYCEQQGGECPYRHNGAANSTEHHGHSEYCLQNADYCAQQGGDCPYRQESHHGSGHHGDSHH